MKESMQNSMKQMNREWLPTLLRQYAARFPGMPEEIPAAWKMEEPMNRHTTFRIGGSAALYTECTDAATAAALIGACRETGVRYCVIGNGSNLLVDDAGFDGVILSTTGMRNVSVADGRMLCEAGASLTGISAKAEEAGYAGMEFACGIPGTCGGAVFMNAGAYDGEMADLVVESTYLNAEDGKVHVLQGAAHAFGYRQSIYRAHPAWMILSATLALPCGDRRMIREKTADFMRRRREKQPLNMPSAGSVFKRYPGRYTAQMIDEAGLKGKQIGGAMVSTKHAGFIVNTGSATAADVMALISLIQETILRREGIAIECELVYIH